MLLNNELIFNLHCIFLFYLHEMPPGRSIMQNNDKAMPEEGVWNKLDSSLWNISLMEVGGNFSSSLSFSGADGPNELTEKMDQKLSVINTVCCNGGEYNPIQNQKIIWDHTLFVNEIHKKCRRSSWLLGLQCLFPGSEWKQKDVEMLPLSSALYANDRCVCILSWCHFYLLMEI